MWIGVLSTLFVAVAVGVFVVLRAPASLSNTDVTPAAAAATGPATPPEQAVPAQTPTSAPAAPVALSVRSTPIGAAVFVDGQALGKTPVILPLNAGSNVELKLSARGHVTKTEKLAIVAGMDAREIALEPLPYELVVTTEPPGAIVSAAGRTAESPNPLVLNRVDAAVAISVEKVGFQRVIRNVRPDEFQERENAYRAELALTLAPATVPASDVAKRRRAAASGLRALSLEPPAPEANPENPEAEGPRVVQVKGADGPAVKADEAPTGAAPAQPPAAAQEPAAPAKPDVPAEAPKAAAPEPSEPPAPPTPPAE
jgi:hypothetical protein